MSTETATLPYDWKIGEITEIHKNGSKANVSNYRPVSLTNLVRKIAESLIRDRIMIHFISVTEKYFIFYSLFSSKQFGFIKSRSTVLQLLRVHGTWVKILEGGQIDVIYTDFAKAFDKVPHCRLISKLSSYGVNDQLILWIKDLLLHRSKTVKINNEFLAWHSVVSGIPQGSECPRTFVICEFYK